jgi:cytochrome c oxidase assembly protein subunit 19
MQLYMACLREHSGTSTPCRNLVRDYLDCRMNRYVCAAVFLVSSRYAAELDVSQRGLMEKDDWKNLGLANLDKNVVPVANADNATPPAVSEMPTDKKL